MMRARPGPFELAVAVGAFFATATPGLAVVDATYRCLTETDVAGATSSENGLNLPAGSTVVVVLDHFCMGYCRATVIIEAGTKFDAYTPLHLNQGVKLPPDRIVQHDGAMDWFHAMNGDPEQMIKIRMACKPGSGFN